MPEVSSEFLNRAHENMMVMRIVRQLHETWRKGNFFDVDEIIRNELEPALKRLYPEKGGQS